MQSNILNIENWSSYKDEVGTHYTYKINNHYTYELYIGYDNIILDNDLYNLTICKIEEDDYYDIEKMFIMFIFCTTGMLKTAIYNTNSVTEIINDYKSNKIKEIIIIENQDTTYKYKY